MSSDAAATPPPADKKDQLVQYLERLEAANESFYDKMRQTSDDLETKMEALAGAKNLSSYPTFRPFVESGRVFASLRRSDTDRAIVVAYLNALVTAGTVDKADALRKAVLAAIGPSK